MKNKNNGFNLGSISLFLFTILIIFMKYFYRLLNDFDTLVFITLTFAIGIISSLGFIKSIKESKTTKKIIGLLLNGLLVLMFIFTLISYAFDLF